MPRVLLLVLLVSAVGGALAQPQAAPPKNGPRQCTLDGAARRAAVAEAGAFFAEHGARLSRASLTVRFPKLDVTALKTLQELIDRERLCCADLTFDLVVDKTQASLTVAGDPAEVAALRRLLPAP